MRILRCCTATSLLVVTTAVACSTDGPFIKRTEDFGMDIAFQGLSRSYEVHLPSGYTGSQRTPLIFVLHGGGGTGPQIREMSGFDAVADEFGLIAVYPTGRPDWAVEGSPLQEQGIDESAFFEELIERLDNLLVLDRSRVYVTGFSRGGFLAHQLACDLADRLAGAAPIAGTMQTTLANRCSPARRIAVMAVHGTDDSSVPFDGDPTRGLLSVDSTMRVWASENRCDRAPTVTVLGTDPATGITTRRETYPGCADQVGVVLYALAGEQHRWPTSPFDAGRAIASFLLAYQR